VIELEINILLTIGLGLGVPIIIFFITYKKTVGVRRERERTAYREIISIMVKLMTYEQINPNLDVINGVIRSKAREYDVNIDISSLPAIFEDVMTKFVENEFISQDVKKDLIDKMLSLQKEVLEAKEAKEAAVRVEEATTTDLSSTVVAMLGVIAAVIGIIAVTITILPKLVSITPFAIIATITTFFITLVFYRKQTVERAKKERVSASYGSPIFEKMVFSALEKILPKENIEREAVLSGGQRVDFLLQIDNERIPIEVKYRTVQQNAIEQMLDYMRTLEAKRAILITNSSLTPKIKKFAEENNISLIDNVQSEEDIVNRLKGMIITKKYV
jgi:ABC-type multidrug transport system fused ATPase/permease subunit